MGKKGKKKRNGKKHRDPLLTKPDTYQIGETLTIETLYRDHYKPCETTRDNARSTVNSNARYVRRWHEWWHGRSDEPLTLDTIDRRHMLEFQRHLLAQGRCASDVNAHTQHIRKMLKFAADQQFILQAASIESLPAKNKAKKFIFSDDEICQLWAATSGVRWPRRDGCWNPLPHSPGHYWRSLIVLYWHYGYRTEELVSFEKRFVPVKWGDVYPPGLTPNREVRESCEYGWISYVPQKQSKKKDDPLVSPLNKYTRAAIEAVRPYGPVHADRPVYDFTRSSQSFYKAWNWLLDEADVHPRQTPGEEPDRYLIKHFRKTATTNVNRHRRGLGPYVVGHAADRKEMTSIVSDKHYDNVTAAKVECMLSLPVPECFKELL